MGSHHYSKPIIRFAGAMIASLYINLQHRWHLIETALVTRRFYIAVIVSFLLAYLLAYLAEFITNRLDQTHPVYKRKFLRVVYQLLLGVILLLILDMMLMIIYFSAFGQMFPVIDFMIRDFPIIFLFLMLLNYYYLRISPTRFEAETIQESAVEHALEINYNGTFIRLNPSSDILYLQRQGKLVRVITVAGKEYPIPDKIANLSKQFQFTLCQINRSTIVNPRVLKGYLSGVRRDTLQILFKVEYDDLIKNLKQEHFRVTKEHILDFKQSLKDLGHEVK